MMTVNITETHFVCWW